jgi:hypothetical protein
VDVEKLEQVMNKTYERLDSLIIKAISDHHGDPIHNPDVAAEALRIAKARGRREVRVVDGRLIALTESGAIRYLMKSEAPEGKAGWYVASNPHESKK